VLTLCFLLASYPVLADTVFLKNGKTLEGEVIKDDADGVILKVPAGQVKLQRSEVEAIERQAPCDYRLALGRRLLQGERFESAIEAFEEACKADPSSNEARRMLGTALWLQGKKYRTVGRLAEAKTALEQLLKLDPKAELVSHAAADALKELHAQEAEVTDSVELARKFASDNRLEQAVKTFEYILTVSPDMRAAIAPDMAQCHLKLALRFGDSGQRLNAVGQLEAAMRLDPKLGDQLENLYCACSLPGILDCLARGDIASAQTDLKRALEFAPNSKHALYVAGRVEEELKRIPSAADFYARALGTRVANPTPDYLADLRRRLEAEIKFTGKLHIDTTAADLTGYAISSAGPAQKFESENFVFFHYNEALAREASLRAEAARTRVMSDLGLRSWQGKAKIYLHRTQAEYTARTGQPEWTGGVSRATKQGLHCVDLQIHSWQTAPRLLTSVLTHEITHLLVNENLREIAWLPKALHEGFAVMMEPRFRHEYFMNFINLRLKSQNFIPLSELLTLTDYPRDPEFFYAEGYALLAYLTQSKSLADAAAMLKSTRSDTKAPDELLRLSGAATLDALESDWKAWLLKPAGKQ
jgi:tetratricopeptide (TPR) repeat protein